MELKKLGYRVLVAIFGIPIIIFLVVKGGWAIVVLVLIINLLAQYEFYKLTELKKMLPIKILGLVGTVIFTISFYKYGTEKFWLITIIFFYLTLLFELFRNKASATFNISATSLGFFYPAFFFSFIILIRELPKSLNLDYAAGARWIIFMFAAIWICDTAAYFIGSAIGKHKLFHRVSPNKTVEGAIAGFIFAIVTAYIAHTVYIKLLSLADCLVIGAIVGIMSQIGDLVESLFKRDTGIKDTSGILPGHGGFLDRFDAPLFVAPLVFLYLRFIVFPK